MPRARAPLLIGVPAARHLGRPRRRLGASVALLTMASTVGIGPDALGYARPGRTARVSVSSSGIEGNRHSQRPTISADGRYVAFETPSTNLAPDDANGLASDIFVHDRVIGTTELVSVSSDGQAANRSSALPSLSADGRYVTFVSFANNLVPDDDALCSFRSCADVFVHDRLTGETERVSVTSDEDDRSGDSNADTERPATISADGRYVAFWSYADLVPGGTPDFQGPCETPRRAVQDPRRSGEEPGPGHRD